MNLLKKPKILFFVIMMLILTYGNVFSQELMKLPEIAEKIASKKINVGKTPDMDFENRFHNIHNKVIGLECESCHIPNYRDDYLYQLKHKLPERDAPGVVDRGICLGCHKANGPAKTKLYGTAGK